MEQRKAQDYTFEALHRVYFYDAWRTQPVLSAPESDLVAAATWPLDTAAIGRSGVHRTMFSPSLMLPPRQVA